MVTRPGFSLIEVIVAMTLLSVGMLAIAANGLLAARLLNDAELQEEIAIRTQSVLDSLVVNDVNGNGRIDAGVYRIEWTAAAESVVVRARAGNATQLELQAVR